MLYHNKEVIMTVPTQSSQATPDNSKELNSEIDKFSKIIETVIDIEYILRKILK